MQRIEQLPAGGRGRWITATALALIIGGAAGLATEPDGVAAEELPESIFADEDLTLRFRRAVRKRSVDPGTVGVRSGGNAARGRLLVGRPLFDAAQQRRVVVRPEAVREYFQLVKGLPRSAADRKATRFLTKIERTGRFRKLETIDRGLRDFFGPSYGAGTRLDDAGVSAHYPPALDPSDPLAPYRERVACNDGVWQAYVGGDLNAFTVLRTDPECERFFREIDPDSGVPDSLSVLQKREHRRVLVHSSRRYVTFFPELPVRRDATDVPYLAGEEYRITVRKPLRRPRSVTFGLSGGPFAFPKAGVPFTVRTTEPAFAGVDDRAGLAASRPRIVNVTPPNGESLVDATTDWENPDNQFEVPLPARAAFTVRLRFAGPLDPRTVDETTFRLRRTHANVGTPDEQLVFEPVEVGVFLAQTRLGEVRVDVTPAANLDPGSRYEVIVRGTVKGLNGELLETDFVSRFTTR